MGELDEQIREALKRIAGSFGPDILLEGKITGIDTENYLVDVELDKEGQLFDVRLRAVSGGNKSIDILPAEGAAVVIAKIADDEYLVLACDQITEYKITVAQAEFKLTESGHLISKGTETLNKILTDLVDQVLKVYAPKDVPGLTAIKQRINNLLQ